MRSFRFPSISKSYSLIKYEEYHQLSGDESPLDAVAFLGGHDRPEELSTTRLMALTCSAGGLQVVLSLIMSNGTVRTSIT
jgi:hypothetical protein